MADQNFKRHHSNQEPAQKISFRRGAAPSALLLALVRRARWLWLGWLEQRWAALRQWLLKYKPERAKPASPFRIDTFEPRLLMAADAALLQPFAVVDVDNRVPDYGALHSTPTAQREAPQIVISSGLVTATVNVTGPGSGQLVTQETGYLLQLQGTDATSTVSLTASDGSSRITLSGITAAGNVGALNLANADLAGNASFAGSLGSLTLGNISHSLIQISGGGDVSVKAGSLTDAQIVAPLATLSVNATDWSGSTAGASLLKAAGLKTLATTGDLGIDLQLSGAGFTTNVLSTVQVGGAITGGLWSVHGRAGSINANSSSAPWKLNVSSALVQFITKGDAGGRIAAAALQVLQVGGSARGLQVVIGADLGDDAALGGSGANADSFKPGTLARVRISGSLIDSQIDVSVDPVNGQLGDGNDRQLGTPVQRLQELLIGGTIQGSSRIVAPVFPTSVRINGQTLNPASVSALSSTPADTTAPSLALQLRADSGASSTDSLSNDPSIRIQAADAGGLAGFQVALDDKAPQAVTPSAQADGSYLLSASQLNTLAGGPLAQGSHTVQIRVSDTAGNSTAKSFSFSLDDIAPGSASIGLAEASDTGPLGDNRTTENTVTLTGLAEAGVVVQLNGKTNLGTVTAAADGRFNFNVVPLDLGANSFTLTQTDAAGNSRSQAYEVTREQPTVPDTTKPTVSAALVQDTGTSSSDGITRNPAIQGTASDDRGVTQLLAALDPGATPSFTNITSSLNADGSFSLSAAQLASLAGGTLGQGAHTLRLIAKDAAGNESAPFNLSFTLDTAAPALSSFGLAPASDTGTQGDNRTTESSVTLAGTAEAAATVSLQSGGSTLGTVTAAADGSFSFSSIALALGSNEFSLTLTDAAGNTSSSSSLTVIRDAVVVPDTTKPTVSAALVQDTGSSSSDGITRNPAVQGTATDDRGVTQLLAALDPGATPVFTDLTASLNADGSFSLSAAQLASLAGGTLGQGAHTLRLIAKDAAGNESTPFNLSFTLDTTAPSTASIGLAEASDTAPLGDNRTTDSTVTLSGLSEAGVVIQIDGKASLGTVTVAADGRFNFNVVPLDLGANSFVITQTDAAGNSRSQDYSVVRDPAVVPDTTQPTVSAALVQDTGGSSTDGITRNPAVQGSATDDRSVTQLLAALDPGATPSFTDISANLAADGSFNLSAAQLASLSGGSLGQGAHTLRLIAKDAAGNESTPFNLSFTFDTSAPGLNSFGLAPPSDTGTPGDSITTEANITLVGAAEPGAAARLQQGDKLLGSMTVAADGSFSFSGVTLALGGNDFNLTLTDAAGNTSTSGLSITREAAVVPDTTKPNVSAALVQDTGSSGTDSITRNPAIQGTASDDRGVTQMLAALDPSATPSFTDITPNLNADGSFSLSAAQLATLAGGTLGQGAHTLRLVARDAAGNESTPFNLSFTLDTSAPAAATIGLAEASDTAPLGDNRTTENTVTLRGLAEAGVVIQLNRNGNLGSTTAAADGRFNFNVVSLDLGANSFTITQTDAAGNSRSQDYSVVRDPATVPDTKSPSVSASLAEDTGSLATDGITRNPAVQGTVSDDRGVTRLLSVIDPGAAPSFTDITAILNTDGSFSLNAAQLASLAGGTLGQGAHTLRLIAQDAAGNASEPFDLAFTLDTGAPALNSFGLAPASDTGTPGDNRTTEASATLLGSAEPGSTAKLQSGANTLGTVTVPANGNFSFAGVALALGSNAFILTLTDAAGNSSAGNLTVTREAVTAGDNTAPVVTAALTSDTGASASDGITSNPAVSGQATDAVGVTQLLAVLDPGATPSFTNITSNLQANGSFGISATQLASLAGGTLGQGAHTLRLVARDAAGNESQAFDLSFTLDSVAPTGASFGIAAADAADGNDGQTSAAIAVLRGTAEANATVTLAAQGLSTTASSTGVFQLPGVALALGSNSLELTVKDAAGNSQTVTRNLTRVVQTQSDAVLDWVNVALKAIQLDVTDPAIATRVLAIQSVAVYDTLAAIQGTPAFLVQRSVTGDVNAQAAAAQAAYRVLYALYPGQRDILAAALAKSLSPIADGTAKTAGIAMGDSIAQSVLSIRANDGYLDFAADDGSTALGKWRPTGPMYLVAQDPQWADVAPFALTSPDQFRASPPPSLDSAEYAAALNEVKSVGSATSTTRTANQTQQAQFWADGGGSYTPPGHWNQIAAQIAAAQGQSLSANARLMAQLNVALADAAIACWDTKYEYDFWRPVTAIQNADQDGNDATTQDANWEPLLLTPPHPSYVSGHSSFSAAAAGILAATFGDNTAFSTTSVTLLDKDGRSVARSFSSFSQAADEAGVSRIYGGIHTSLDNTAGKTIGTQVAQAVLAKFALTQDTQAPSVVLEATAEAVKTNPSFNGQVLDNLSGVASARYSLDGGTPQALTLDANGRFGFSTALATNGTADGSHTLSITATDAAGNTSTAFSRDFTLDTRAPTVTLTSVAEGDSLSDTTRLTGSAAPNGGILASLSYQIDAGTSRNLIFDAVTGSFDEPLTLRDLAVGDHTLKLTATDAAGNSTTLSRAVKLDQLAPFTISKLTPTDGSADVGVTYRPQVFFSRAVNAATLTSDSFYATGPDGSKLAATIVPALDGSFAWMFFTNPMPGASNITLHLKGSAIRAAADGSFLDADGNGTAGGDLDWSFTTVSTSSVLGAKLKGKVVDPGADLQPMTFDDIRRGPDGVIHTGDDAFLNPIVNAKVFIVGRPDLTTFTDKDGNFSFDNVPVGNVKVAVDGRTATNAPTGVFWPEMVMDTTLRPGITNTLMGSMGSAQSQQENADRVEVYLPRVQTSALQQVSDTAPTTITVDEKSAPDLTDAQRGELKLVVAPGSAVGSDGKVLTDVKIGINTVPPELIKDMMPPGLTDIRVAMTIQAPGVTNFLSPLELRFPNVYGMAPGEQTSIFSFDHTTGRLQFSGRATVTTDGLSLLSNVDSGVLAPGWFGPTPQGNR